MVYDEGRPNGRASRYTDEDRQTLDQAKRIHKETTASANRALKTANRTKELAANTLEELERQGDKLEMIDQDLNTIDADVKEAKGVLSYMQRCCLCFLCSCCCDCDPSVKEDKTRKARTKQSKADRENFRGMVKENRAAANGVPADFQEPVDEEETRGALFQSKAQSQGEKQAKRNRNAAYSIGKDLDEPDRREIQSETHQQEKTLDALGDALGDMKKMSQAMRSELDRQAPAIDRLTTHVEQAQGDLANVQKSAEKTLGKKGTRKVQRKYMPSQTQVAAHPAKGF
jgi:uncharacterized phage infection (PIP) family protein YhgE